MVHGRIVLTTAGAAGLGAGRGKERKPMNGMVAAAGPSATHTFNGQIEDGIGLLAEGGFERDAHVGEGVTPARR